MASQKVSVIISAVGLFCLARPGIPVQAFNVPSSPTLPSRSAPRSITSIRPLAAAAEDSTKAPADTEAVNGESGGGGGLILQADAKSQLFASFAALSLSDQYDAVLTGLCAKILDSADATPEKAMQALQDPLQLIEEMNAKKIPASARSLMALVDVRVYECI